jgi:inosine-uridine nucleoside N-ribohydrolase
VRFLGVNVPEIVTENQTILESASVPVLVLTDDGRDVDDIEALTYFAGAGNTEFAGIVTTHMIPDRRANIARAVMSNLGYDDVPIGVGSIFPLGKEDNRLVKYLREHTIEGKTYEGDGLIECFPDGPELIGDAIDIFGPDLRIAGLAPLTDLAIAASHDPDTFRNLGGLHIQGQAIVDESTGQLHPDPAAYNLAEDMAAAEYVFQFQDQVPMTFVGKYSAYKVPLSATDFETFAATGNPVGHYLKVHAEKGLECFAKRAPEVFERVFKTPADRFESLTERSKPYDALVAKSIVRPEGLIPQMVGHHTLYGMSPEHPGIQDPAYVYSDLMTTMLSALSRPLQR